MGTAILFTAARMQAIEDGTVVSGLVDGAGHLILRRNDESTFDAGKVTAENLADASTIQKGIVQLATDTSSIEGTSDTLAITPSNLTAVVADRLKTADQIDALLSLLVPSGSVMDFAGAVEPSGWMFLDGRSLLRSTYAGLFAALGTAYGAADVDHFNIPDKSGRVSVGIDSTQTEFDTLGEKSGAKTHTLTVGELPQHSHPLTYNNSSLPDGIAGGSAAGGFVNWFLGNNAYSADPGNRLKTAAAGGGLSHNNLQPYIALNSIIKI